MTSVEEMHSEEGGGESCLLPACPPVWWEQLILNKDPGSPLALLLFPKPHFLISEGSNAAGWGVSGCSVWL